MRRVNERAFFAKTDCATGAKIGHIANNIEFIDKSEYELICVHAGQNNVTQDEAVDMEAWKKQTQHEVSKLKNSLTKFKNAILVGVPPAPWCKKTATTQEMRKKINTAFKKIAHDNLNIKYIDIEQEDEDDDANWEDQRHMTEKFTSYVLGKVAEQVQDIKGEPFCIRNIKWTSERKYGQVNPTYKVGCETCTEIGHSGESCQGIVQTDTPTMSTKKRGRGSASEESASKK